MSLFAGSAFALSLAGVPTVTPAGPGGVGRRSVLEAAEDEAHDELVLLAVAGHRLEQ